MTVGKASALAAGFVGAVALGVAIGPTVQDKWAARTTPTPSAVTASPTESAPAPAPAKTRARRAATASSRSAEARPAVSRPAGSVRSVKVEVWEPELRDRVKKVLNPGTRIELAAEHFESPEQP